MRNASRLSLKSIKAISLWMLALINLWMYGYPLFRGVSYIVPIGRPHIRMLILADPHIEGDAKIARMGWRGAIDLWGNDLYLGHIHRIMRYFVQPTHTVVLGDHMSSQWIDDAEFYRRSQRFEDTVLRWRKGEERFNISGNHDIGYAGDITSHRLTRWHLRFGPSNYLTEISAGTTSANDNLRLIGLNDLLLDGPAIEEHLRNATLSFLVNLPDDTRQTILLTHVPLFKSAGICVDPPHMRYYDAPTSYLREQNHLSEISSKLLLNSIFHQNDGFVLTGHDHEGCRTFHTSKSNADSWTARQFDGTLAHRAHTEGLRVVEEATVRSIMGQYGGNAGVLAATFDSRSKRWSFKYRDVLFMHNTLWWLSHIFSALICVELFLMWFLDATEMGRGIQLALRQRYGTRDRSYVRKHEA